MKNVYRYTGTGNTGTMTWLLQRISGVALVILIAIHFIGMKRDVDIAMNPLVMLFLGFFTILHAFNGMKMVSDDYVTCKTGRIVLYIIYWIFGLICTGMGIKILFTMNFM